MVLRRFPKYVIAQKLFDVGSDACVAIIGVILGKHMYLTQQEGTIL